MASWEVDPGHSVVHVTDADGRRICAVGNGPYWQPYGQQDLDHARLIAAAPDMLAALKAMQAYAIAEIQRGGAHHDPVWAQVADAIAKAEARHA